MIVTIFTSNERNVRFVFRNDSNCQQIKIWIEQFKSVLCGTTIMKIDVFALDSCAKNHFFCSYMIQKIYHKFIILVFARHLLTLCCDGEWICQDYLRRITIILCWIINLIVFSLISTISVLRTVGNAMQCSTANPYMKKKSMLSKTTNQVPIKKLNLIDLNTKHRPLHSIVLRFAADRKTNAKR